MVRIPKLDKRRLAEQVEEAIQTSILDGSLRPGDPLPSERDMAERFGISRAGIREALHRLDARGLIEVRHGGATRVRDFLVTAGLQLLPALVGTADRRNPEIVCDFLMIRAMLMAWTAQQAAATRPSADLEPLRAILADLEREGVDEGVLKVRDFDFFQELVRLTGNKVLALLVNAIREVYFEHTELFAEIYRSGRFDARHHRETVAALDRGDGPAASRAMEAYAHQALRAWECPPPAGGSSPRSTKGRS